MLIIRTLTLLVQLYYILGVEGIEEIKEITSEIKRLVLENSKI